LALATDVRDHPLSIAHNNRVGLFLVLLSFLVQSENNGDGILLEKERSDRLIVAKNERGCLTKKLFPYFSIKQGLINSKVTCL
jgi:hypothetical protein